MRKATPTWEALIFGANRRATFLQDCVFARIIDATDFFIISATLLFRRDQHNRTLVLYVFAVVSSWRRLGTKLKIICCRHAFIGSGETLNASSSGYCVRRQIRSMPATNSGMLIGLRI